MPSMTDLSLEQPEPSVQNRRDPFARFMNSLAAVVLLLVLASALRILGTWWWSMWQDEETAIYFALRLEKDFAQCFPLFFYMLRGIFEITGISVVAGRLLASLFGVLSIWITVHWMKKHTSGVAAICAGLMLALCLGHLFWSQSVRYYTLCLACQMAATCLFYDGLEEDRFGKLIAGGVFFVLALFSHFTAILLLPVWVGYLLLVFCMKQKPVGISLKNFVALSVPILAGLVIFVPRYLALRNTDALGIVVPVQYAGPLLVRIVAYYGVPMVGLALLAPLQQVAFYCLGRRRCPSRNAPATSRDTNVDNVLSWRQAFRRPLLLMLALAAIPTLELIVLGYGALALVTWNHGMVAMFGVAMLAGLTIGSLYDHHWKKVSLSLLALSLVYYTAFLCLYYTQMHGDRPRWQEGAELVARVGKDERNWQTMNRARATVPDLVAHYLGVAPGKTKESNLVGEIALHPPTHPAHRDEYYVVKADHVTDEYRNWFNKECVLLGEFPANTLSIDRTVSVYFRARTRARMDAILNKARSIQQAETQKK